MHVQDNIYTIQCARGAWLKPDKEPPSPSPKSFLEEGPKVDASVVRLRTDLTFQDEFWFAVPKGQSSSHPVFGKRRKLQSISLVAFRPG